MRAGWLLAVPLGFLAVFFAWPLAATLVAADGDAWAWIGGAFVRRRLVGALWMAVLSVVATFALALPLAWHHHRRRIPWGRVHLALHAAPFVLPVFVIVHGMREVFGPTGWTHAAFGLDLLGALGPLGTVVLAHAYYNYGFAARLIHTALERRPSRLEEAARTLGASPGRAFWTVTVPLLAPSIAAVALLVFLFAFTSFGVVLLMGEGAVATPESMIYQNLGGAFPRTGRAAALGIVQLLVNAGVVLAYLGLLRRARGRRLAAEPRRTRPPAARRDQLIAGGVLVAGLLPALAVLVGGFRVRGGWTLEAWRSLLDNSHPDHPAGFDLLQAVARSLGYAVGAMVLAVVLALLLGWGLRRAGRLRPWAETLAALPLGTSSILLGLGYILAFGAGSWLDLRGTPGAIVIVHSLIGFPFAARVLLPAIDLHDRRLDEAAAVLGATWRQTVMHVQLPLLRGPLAAAAGFAAAMSLGDFGASLLLMRRETQSLALWIPQVDEPFHAIANAQSVALAAVLLVLTAGAILAVERGARA